MRYFRERASIRLGVALLYAFTNAVCLHAAEGNFWAERRKASRRLSHSGPPVSDVDAHPSKLTSEQYQLLAQLPSAGRMDFRAAEPAAVSGGLAARSAASARDFSKADKEHVPAWISTLVLPYGAIRDLHIASKPGAPLVVHIQDAHGLEEAQRNVSSLIQGLQQERGISFVGLEGAHGAFALDPFRAYPDPDVTKGIADYFLKEGTIGGAEHAALTASTPPFLWGVEDKASYEDNIQSFKDSLKNKPAVHDVLAGFEAAAGALKERLYPPALKDFDRHSGAYQDRKEGLGAYVKYLLSAFPGSKTPYPNLRLLTEALHWEEDLDFKRVEKERLRLVEVLARKLPEPVLNRLVQQSLLYRAGRMTYGDYYRFLRTLCGENRISLDEYGELSNYITYVLLAERINRNDLLTELTGLEVAVQDALAPDVARKRLVVAARSLKLLEKLTSHAMTPGDWMQYQRNKRDVQNAPLELRVAAMDLPAGEGVSVPRPPEGFPALLAPFENFCAYALERNNALVGNLLAKMRAENTPAAILVAGGFHTDGLTQILRREDVSYVVVTPRITDVPKENNYLDVFARDPQPLEQMFKGDKINMVMPLVHGDSNLFSPRSLYYRAATAILQWTWGRLPPETAVALALRIPGIAEADFEGDAATIRFKDREESLVFTVGANGGRAFSVVLNGKTITTRILARRAVSWSSLTGSISQRWKIFLTGARAWAIRNLWWERAAVSVVGSSLVAAGAYFAVPLVWVIFLFLHRADARAEEAEWRAAQAIGRWRSKRQWLAAVMLRRAAVSFLPFIGLLAPGFSLAGQVFPGWFQATVWGLFTVAWFGQLPFDRWVKASGWRHGFGELRIVREVGSIGGVVLKVAKRDSYISVGHDKDSRQIDAILEDTGRLFEHVLRTNPEPLLAAFRRKFPAATITMDQMKSLTVDFIASGTFKDTSQVEIEFTTGEKVALIIGIKTDVARKGEENELLEEGEYAAHLKLKDTGLASQVLGLLYIEKTDDGYGAVTSGAEPVWGYVTLMVEEFVAGPTLGQLEDENERIDVKTARRAVALLVKVFFALNVGRKVDFWAPWDYHRYNIIRDENDPDGRLVMIDLGKQIKYRDVGEYLMGIILLYGTKVRGSKDDGHPLEVLYEDWPEIDWDGYLSRIQQKADDAWKKVDRNSLVEVYGRQYDRTQLKRVVESIDALRQRRLERAGTVPVAEMPRPPPVEAAARPKRPEAPPDERLTRAVLGFLKASRPENMKADQAPSLAPLREVAASVSKALESKDTPSILGALGALREKLSAFTDRGGLSRALQATLSGMEDASAPALWESRPKAPEADQSAVSPGTIEPPLNPAPEFLSGPSEEVLKAFRENDVLVEFEVVRGRTGERGIATVPPGRVGDRHEKNYKISVHESVVAPYRQQGPAAVAAFLARVGVHEYFHAARKVPREVLKDFGLSLEEPSATRPFPEESMEKYTERLIALGTRAQIPAFIRKIEALPAEAGGRPLAARAELLRLSAAMTQDEAREIFRQQSSEYNAKRYRGREPEAMLPWEWRDRLNNALGGATGDLEWALENGPEGLSETKRMEALADAARAATTASALAMVWSAVDQERWAAAQPAHLRLQYMQSTDAQLFGLMLEAASNRGLLDPAEILKGNILNVGLAMNLGRLSPFNLVTDLKELGIKDVVGMGPEIPPAGPEGWYERGDVQRMPFKDGAFDAVACFGLFNEEYFDIAGMERGGSSTREEFYGRAARDIFRVLKPAGRAFFYVGSQRNPKLLEAFSKENFSIVELNPGFFLITKLEPEAAAPVPPTGAAGFGVVKKERAGAYMSPTEITNRVRELRRRVDAGQVPDGFQKIMIRVAQESRHVYVHEKLVDRIRNEHGGMTVEDFLRRAIAWRKEGTVAMQKVFTKKAMIFDLLENPPSWYGNHNGLDGYVYVDENAPPEVDFLGVSHELLHESGQRKTDADAEARLAEEDARIAVANGLDLAELAAEVDETVDIKKSPFFRGVPDEDYMRVQRGRESLFGGIPAVVDEEKGGKGGGFKATQQATEGLLKDWEAATGFWGRVLKRPLATFLRPLGVALIEDLGLARPGVSWWQAILQGRVPAAVTGGLVLALQASGVGYGLLVPLAVVMALLFTVSRFQQDFIAGHVNDKTRYLIARTAATFLFNLTALLMPAVLAHGIDIKGFGRLALWTATRGIGSAMAAHILWNGAVSALERVRVIAPGRWRMTTGDEDRLRRFERAQNMVRDALSAVEAGNFNQRSAHDRLRIVARLVRVHRDMLDAWVAKPAVRGGKKAGRGAAARLEIVSPGNAGETIDPGELARQTHLISMLGLSLLTGGSYGGEKDKAVSPAIEDLRRDVPTREEVRRRIENVFPPHEREGISLATDVLLRHAAEPGLGLVPLSGAMDRIADAAATLAEKDLMAGQEVKDELGRELVVKSVGIDPIHLLPSATLALRHQPDVVLKGSSVKKLILVRLAPRVREAIGRVLAERELKILDYGYVEKHRDVQEAEGMGRLLEEYDRTYAYANFRQFMFARAIEGRLNNSGMALSDAERRAVVSELLHLMVTTADERHVALGRVNDDIRERWGLPPGFGSNVFPINRKLNLAQRWHRDFPRWSAGWILTHPLVFSLFETAGFALIEKLWAPALWAWVVIAVVLAAAHPDLWLAWRDASRERRADEMNEEDYRLFLIQLRIIFIARAVGAAFVLSPFLAALGPHAPLKTGAVASFLFHEVWNFFNREAVLSLPGGGFSSFPPSKNSSRPPKPYSRNRFLRGLQASAGMISLAVMGTIMGAMVNYAAEIQSIAPSLLVLAAADAAMILAGRPLMTWREAGRVLDRYLFDRALHLSEPLYGQAHFVALKGLRRGGAEEAGRSLEEWMRGSPTKEGDMRRALVDYLTSDGLADFSGLSWDLVGKWRGGVEREGETQDGGFWSRRLGVTSGDGAAAAALFTDARERLGEIFSRLGRVPSTEEGLRLMAMYVGKMTEESRAAALARVEHVVSNAIRQERGEILDPLDPQSFGEKHFISGLRGKTLEEIAREQVHLLAGDGDRFSDLNKALDKRIVGLLTNPLSPDVLFSKASPFVETRRRLGELMLEEGGYLYAGAGGDEFLGELRGFPPVMARDRVSEVVDRYNESFQGRFAFFTITSRDGTDLGDDVVRKIEGLPEAVTLVRHGRGYRLLADLARLGVRGDSAGAVGERINGVLGRSFAATPIALEREGLGPFRISVGALPVAWVVKRLVAVTGGEYWFNPDGTLREERLREVYFWSAHLADDVLRRAKARGRNRSFIPFTEADLDPLIKKGSITENKIKRERARLAGDQAGGRAPLAAEVHHPTGALNPEPFRVKVKALPAPPAYFRRFTVSRYRSTLPPARRAGNWLADRLPPRLAELLPFVESREAEKVVPRAFHGVQDMDNVGHDGGDDIIKAVAGTVRDILASAGGGRGAPVMGRVAPDGFDVASDHDIRGPPAEGIEEIVKRMGRALQVRFNDPAFNPHMIVYEASTEVLEDFREVFRSFDRSRAAVFEKLDALGKFEWLQGIMTAVVEDVSRNGSPEDARLELEKMFDVEAAPNHMVLRFSAESGKVRELFVRFREAQERESREALARLAADRPAAKASAWFSAWARFWAVLWTRLNPRAGKARPLERKILRGIHRTWVAAFVVPFVELILLPGLALRLNTAAGPAWAILLGALITTLVHGIPAARAPPRWGRGLKFFRQDRTQFFVRLGGALLIHVLSFLPVLFPTLMPGVLLEAFQAGLNGMPVLLVDRLHLTPARAAVLAIAYLAHAAWNAAFSQTSSSARFSRRYRLSLAELFGPSAGTLTPWTAHFQQKVRKTSARYGLPGRRGKTAGADIVKDVNGNHVPIALDALGVTIKLDRRILDAASLSAGDLAARLNAAFSRLKPDDLGALASRLAGQPLTFAYLDSSSHLFENHRADGLIGVNGDLLDAPLSPEQLIAALAVGLAHELRHEALGPEADHGAAEAGFLESDVAFTGALLGGDPAAIASFAETLSGATGASDYVLALSPVSLIWRSLKSHPRTNSETQGTVRRAVEIVRELYGDARFPSGLSYFHHAMSVAAGAAEAGVGPEGVVAALLQRLDAPAPGSRGKALESLRKGAFKEAVSDILARWDQVDGLPFSIGLMGRDFKEGDSDLRTAVQDQGDMIRKLLGEDQPLELLRLLLEGKKAAMETVPEPAGEDAEDESDQRVYFRSELLLYAYLAEELLEGESAVQARDATLSLAQVARVQRDFFKRHGLSYGEAMAEMRAHRRELDDYLKSRNIQAKVMPRPGSGLKSFWSIRTKSGKQDRGLKDLFGLMVVSNDTKAVYAVQKFYEKVKNGIIDDEKSGHRVRRDIKDYRVHALLDAPDRRSRDLEVLIQDELNHARYKRGRVRTAIYNIQKVWPHQRFRDTPLPEAGTPEERLRLIQASLADWEIALVEKEMKGGRTVYVAAPLHNGASAADAAAHASMDVFDEYYAGLTPVSVRVQDGRLISKREMTPPTQVKTGQALRKASGVQVEGSALDDIRSSPKRAPRTRLMAAVAAARRMKSAKSRERIMEGYEKAGREALFPGVELSGEQEDFLEREFGRRGLKDLHELYAWIGALGDAERKAPIQEIRAVFERTLKAHLTAPVLPGVYRIILEADAGHADLPADWRDRVLKEFEKDEIIVLPQDGGKSKNTGPLSLTFMKMGSKNADFEALEAVLRVPGVKMRSMKDVKDAKAPNFSEITVEAQYDRPGLQNKMERILAVNELTCLSKRTERRNGEGVALVFVVHGTPARARAALDGLARIPDAPLMAGIRTRPLDVRVEFPDTEGNRAAVMEASAALYLNIEGDPESGFSEGLEEERVGEGMDRRLRVHLRVSAPENFSVEFIEAALRERYPKEGGAGALEVDIDHRVGVGGWTGMLDGPRRSTWLRPSVQMAVDIAPFLRRGKKLGHLNKVVVSSVVDKLRRQGGEGMRAFFDRLERGIKGLSEHDDDFVEDVIDLLAKVPSDLFDVDALLDVIHAAEGSLFTAEEDNAYRNTIKTAIQKAGLRSRIHLRDIYILLKMSETDEESERLDESAFVTHLRNGRDGTAFPFSEVKFAQWNEEELLRPGYSVNATAMALFHELAESKRLPHERLRELGLTEDGLKGLYDKLSPDEIMGEIRLLGEQALAEAARRNDAFEVLKGLAPAGKMTDDLERSLRVAAREIPLEASAAEKALSARYDVNASDAILLEYAAGSAHRLDSSRRGGYAWGLVNAVVPTREHREAMHACLGDLMRRFVNAPVAVREAVLGYVTAREVLAQGRIVESLAEETEADREVFPVVHAPQGLTVAEAAEFARQVADVHAAGRLRGVAVAASDMSAWEAAQGALIAAGVPERMILRAPEEKSRSEAGLYYLDDVLKKLNPAVYRGLMKDLEFVSIPVLSPIIADWRARDEKLKARMILLQALAGRLVRVEQSTLEGLRGSLLALIAA